MPAARKQAASTVKPGYLDTLEHLHMLQTLQDARLTIESLHCSAAAHLKLAAECHLPALWQWFVQTGPCLLGHAISSRWMPGPKPLQESSLHTMIRQR